MPAPVRGDRQHVRARLGVEYLEGRRLLSASPLFEVGEMFHAPVHARGEADEHDHGSDGDHKEMQPPKAKDEDAPPTSQKNTDKDQTDVQQDKVLSGQGKVTVAEGPIALTAVVLRSAKGSTPKTDREASLDLSTTDAVTGPSVVAPVGVSGPAPHRDTAPQTDSRAAEIALSLEEAGPLPGHVSAGEETNTRAEMTVSRGGKDGQSKLAVEGFGPLRSPLDRQAVAEGELVTLAGFWPTSAVAEEVAGTMRDESLVPAEGSTGDARVSELLTAGVPFDALTFDAGLEHFLKRVSEVGEQLGRSLGSLPLQSWLVAVSLAVGACDIARRQLRHSGRRRLFAATAADSLSWSLTLTASGERGQ